MQKLKVKNLSICSELVISGELVQTAKYIFFCKLVHRYIEHHEYSSFKIIFVHRQLLGGVLLLVKLQATCNFTKSNTPPWSCLCTKIV